MIGLVGDGRSYSGPMRASWLGVCLSLDLPFCFYANSLLFGVTH